MKRILFAGAALATAFLFSTASHAQNLSPTPSPTTPTPTPSPSPIAIKAGRLLDVKTGKISNNVYISIENHRIKSVSAEAPAGVRVIDLSGAFVMPGMVDCHAHILGDLGDRSPGSSFRMSSAKKDALGHEELEGLARARFHGLARCRRRRSRLWATGVARCDQCRLDRWSAHAIVGQLRVA